MRKAKLTPARQPRGGKILKACFDFHQNQLQRINFDLNLCIERTCRVCKKNDGKLISPCLCSLPSIRYAHPTCLTVMSCDFCTILYQQQADLSNMHFVAR